MNNKVARIRRARKTRARIDMSGKIRLCVHRTSKHIYANLISVDGASVLASSSTVQATIKKDLKVTGNKIAAQAVGKDIAKKAKKVGVEVVAFDRSGFKYHGRILELANAARESGLKF